MFMTMVTPTSTVMPTMVVTTTMKTVMLKIQVPGIQLSMRTNMPTFTLISMIMVTFMMLKTKAIQLIVNRIVRITVQCWPTEA